MGWLEEALKITTGDRRRDYGTPLINHLRIAVRWNILYAKKLRSPITPVDVAMGVIDLKIAREQQTHKDDNFVDMIGYINCIDSMHTDMVQLGYENGIEAFKVMSFEDLTGLLVSLENNEYAEEEAQIERAEPKTSEEARAQAWLLDNGWAEWNEQFEEDIIRKLTDAFKRTRIDMD